MEQFAQSRLLIELAASTRDAGDGLSAHMERLASSIEQALAVAHEEGKEEAVRVLHALLGILQAAPRQ